MDMDLSAFGLPSGFGKKSKAKVDVQSRFDSTKRDESAPPAVARARTPERSPQIGQKRGRTDEDEEDDDGDDDVGPQPAAPLRGPLRGPQRGPQPAADRTNGETADAVQEPEWSDGDGDDDEEEFAPEDDLPITHEVLLKDHTKAISALTLDPSGARVLSGSHDYDCKLWDFGGMDGNFRPFRGWEAAGNYPVHDVAYSPTGASFLVVTGTAQAKLYDRDGEEQAEFIKGDPYIRDMKHTLGHVGELTACEWHPRENGTFITSSVDSTIRIWEAEQRRKQKSVIVVKSKDRGARTRVTWCGYGRDGGMIAGACADGALHLWASKSNFVRPTMSAEGAHEKGTETGGCAFALDGWGLVSRGGDGTVKLWDTRKFRQPLATAFAPVLYPGTNITYSPDGKYIVTGTSSGASRAEAETEGMGSGKLLVLRREGLEVERELPMGGRGVIRVVWHPKINQIVLGHADGMIRVLYSPSHSLNGAKLCVPRAPRARTIEDYAAQLYSNPILLPEEPNQGRPEDERPNKRRRDKERMETGGKTRRPMPPVTGPGRGGRVGASATQHIVQHLFRDTTRDEDPREALLKYADAAEKDPVWTSAWKQNQPKPVFQEIDNTEEKEEE